MKNKMVKLFLLTVLVLGVSKGQNSYAGVCDQFVEEKANAFEFQGICFLDEKTDQAFLKDTLRDYGEMEYGDGTKRNVELRINERTNDYAILLDEEELFDFYLLSQEDQVSKGLFSDIGKGISSALPRINHNGHRIFDARSIARVSICQKTWDINIVEVVTCPSVIASAGAVCVEGFGAVCIDALYAASVACGIPADELLDACYR